MKLLDTTNYNIVYCGLSWPYKEFFCTKDMTAFLERNEALISWLQPKRGGLQDQVPALLFSDKFYMLSLRMMKSVWRHVRLRKGFINEQTIPNVGVILRIPQLLLVEKIRTQERFDVGTICVFLLPALY